MAPRSGGIAAACSTAVIQRESYTISTIVSNHCLTMILLLTSVGIVFFREPLNRYEIAGMIMAISSLVL
jgi:drug/metabolite transporter (DMT)-like permease